MTYAGISVHGSREEEIILAVLGIWRDKFPQDVKEFFLATAEHRKVLKNDKGLSTGLDAFGGSSAIVGHVPMKVYTGIEKMMPDFWYREDANKIFFRIFKKAGIKNE